VQDIDRNHEPLGFPQDVGNRSSDEDTDCSYEPDVDDEFESDIATLRDYSFIDTGEDSMVFTMHRLVQLTVRTWLKPMVRRRSGRNVSITTYMVNSRPVNMKIGRDAGYCFHMLCQLCYIDRNRKTHSEVRLRYSTKGRGMRQNVAVFRL
jgi:hypothetical protein